MRNNRRNWRIEQLESVAKHVGLTVRKPMRGNLTLCDESSHWIPDIEKAELAKVAVVGIERDHAMLTQHGGQVSVRHQIAARGYFGCYSPIDAQETVLLAD